MAYTTLSDVKAYLSISAATDDAVLTGLIPRAQAMIDQYCKRTFEALIDSTKRLDAVRDVSEDRRMLYIWDDLAAITSVTNGDGVAVAGTAYVRRPDGLLLKASSGLTWTYATDPEDAIAVVGKWAYSENAPADIVGACIRLVGYLYRQRDTNMSSDRPMVADGVLILPSRLPDDIKSVLDGRKRVGR
jgi:hypothetical protein